MKILFVIKGFKRLILACALAVLPGTVSLAETYSFGVVPQFEARKLARIWEPILSELSKRTGYDFEIVGAPRIPEFEAAFMGGAYDFAYLNPFHALLAEASQGYDPIVRDGARQLYGIIVVREDSDFTGVDQLNGHEIAFPAPNALGASLMIRADLSQTHGVEFTPNYVSTHSSAYLNVILQQVSAAGGVMGTFRSQPIEISEQLRVLYETERVPPHPISVHPRVPEDVRASVQSAFLDMWKSGYGRELLEQVPILEAVPASLEDYQTLNEMGLDKFVVQ